jgi:hypothetical protein
MANSAELSSIATELEELTARITSIADTAAKADDESTYHDLYEVERALKAAQRRLTKLAR